jgi:hypothetical protein
MLDNIRLSPNPHFDRALKAWSSLSTNSVKADPTPGADNAGDQNANPRAPSKRTKEAADGQATDENGKLRCQYCGTELTKEPGQPNSREFDHFDPYKNGGSNTIDNILDACRTCNRGEGSNSYPDGWQPKYD